MHSSILYYESLFEGKKKYAQRNFNAENINHLDKLTNVPIKIKLKTEITQMSQGFWVL